MTDDDFELRLDDVTIALRFPPSILKPVSLDDSPPPPFAQIETTASIVLDRNLNVSIEGGSSLTLAPCEVAGTGVIISVDQVTWNFERGKTLPAATAAGLIGEFLGVAFQQASVKLPKSITNAPDLLFDYCLVGTGGFTSRFHATWLPVFNEATKRYTGEGAGELFGVPFAIFDTQIEFKLGALTSSKISGKFLLPFFDEYCDLDVGINFDGSLSARISSPDGLINLTKPNLLKMKVDSLAFEVKDGLFISKVAGEITPLVGQGQG